MKDVSTTFADLKEDQFNELLRLVRLYHREARKCEKVKAYLPGCVMLGATLEAGLIAMMHCFAEEVAACESLPREKVAMKPLLKWKLAERLRIAKKLDWLPAGLQLDQAWDAKRAKIGDHAEVIRMLRNLVHPAAYLTEHTAKRVTSRHLSHAFEALDVATLHLLRKLHTSIGAALEQKEVPVE
jgi:hypothetical protein